MNQPDPKATAVTRARYQRVAPFYDLMEVLPERRYSPWRRRLWGMVQGAEILEVGVGTGKNMPYYPKGTQLTAIDLAPRMLAKAEKRAAGLDLQVDLRLGDVQALEFPDNHFDAAVATFVFCSVPDPVLGFRELGRVVKPNGHIYLLEHMRANNPLLGLLMDLFNPVFRLMGPNINRRTVENARAGGLVLEHIEELGANGIFKLMVARKE